MSPSKRQDLFDEEEDGDLLLGVNKDYAKRFQHNKEREELQRLQEKQRKGLLPKENEDSSSSEEEDDGDIQPQTEVKILDVIKRIRSKDPSIYDSSKKFFEAKDGEGGSEEDVEEDGMKEKKKAKKVKPVYLKDVIAQQALARAEAGGEGDSSDDDSDVEKRKSGSTYVEEQEALKKAFKAAAGDEEESEDEEEGGGLVKRRGQRAVDAEPAGDAEEKVNALLSEVFGGGKEGGNGGEGDQFLRDFIVNKGWVEREEEGVPTYREITGGFSDDEEELDEQETFEAQHNFRYEEEGSGRIATHSRQVGDSIRKADDRRKRAREARKARKEAEKAEAATDLKRLKNIKKKELQKKIEKMRKLAGKGAAREEALLAELLEKDFDPEEYDAHMAAAFGEDYYKQGLGANAEDEGDVLDPAYHKELKLLGGTELEGSSALASLREKLGLGGDAEWEDELIGEWDEEAAAAKAAAAEEEGIEEEGDEEAEASKAAVLKALEEYYKLDYEQDIGGLKCRFNYREVDKEDFGLKPEEVLSMEDKELNDLVGMRLLAPYREDGWRLKKQRFKVAAALGPKRRAQAESAVWHDKRKEAKRERQKEKKAAAREGGVKKAETGVPVAGKKVKVKGRGKEKRTNVKGGEVGDVEKLHDQAEKEGGSEEKGKEKEKKATEKGVRAKEARMSSYAVPKLSRPVASQTSGGKGKGKGTKRKREEEREAKLGAKAGLSRAAKRNARRAEKRAEKHVVAE